MANYQIAQLDEIMPVECPCGLSRRAFTGGESSVASVHQVDITTDARTHYHKRMTEIYVILQGEGRIELDGKVVSVRPMSAVMIAPGCRHRAVGQLTLINIAIPAFDPSDEWFD
ncbi:MAG: cupin domain-containing protein [Verrucomicrobiota bacterium]